MKYLYPYECFKRKLSSPSELQSAIDGNRRDSRRTYGSFGSPGGPVDGGYGRVSPPSVSMGYSTNHSPVLRPSPGPSPTGDEVCDIMLVVQGIVGMNRVRLVPGGRASRCAKMPLPIIWTCAVKRTTKSCNLSRKIVASQVTSERKLFVLWPHTQQIFFITETRKSFYSATKLRKKFLF